MPILTAARRLTIAALVLALAALPHPGAAADPYTINAILALTGQGTFIGNEQLAAIQALETTVNKAGGIGGRPVKFNVRDDQSNPAVAVQLVNDLIAQHVPAILGPTITASCNAVTPLVQREGPVAYCLTPGAHPPAGGYVFSTLTSTPDLLAVAMRYFRARGMKRIAYLVPTDASGQDAEQGIIAAMSTPENKSLEIVAREHFGNADVSANAQLTRIKSANPDVLIAWVTGTAAGTALRSIRDSGLTVPMVLSSANMTPSFVKQFGNLFPKETYAPGMLYYARNDVLDRNTRSAISELNFAANVQGTAIDQVYISAWDPAKLLVDAFKTLGTDASAMRVRDYLNSLRGWTGVNGPYDFRAVPQRGIGQEAVLMSKWDFARSEFAPVSKPRGVL